MKNIIEIDMLKKELKDTQKMVFEALNKLDKIKNKLVSNGKVSKQDIIKIIDGGINVK